MACVRWRMIVATTYDTRQRGPGTTLGAHMRQRAAQSRARIRVSNMSRTTAAPFRHMQRTTCPRQPWQRSW